MLATGSNSGYTVVWDLKSKREVTALSYSGMNPAAMNGGGGPQAGYGMPWGAQGKRSVSCVQWHPDNPTKLVTASDDDSNPVILLWDLRNWKEPERILTGHEKGVLSLSWCSQDSDLLLSSGKDGRTIAWNPNKAEIVAELTPSSNWSFDVQWCPRNPSLLSTATLEGKVSVQSIQKTSIPEPQEVEQASTGAVDGAGIFEAAISANAANYPTLSLTQPPKWLQRPASVAFGFGGKLVSVSTAPGAAKSKVKVSSFVAENDVVERAVRLQEATDGEGSLAEFCEARSAEVAQQTGISASVKDSEAASWRLLETLFTTGAGTDARDELIRLLGFNKEEVRKRIAAAIKPSVKASSALARGAGGGADDENDDATSVAREPLVTFAENTADGGLSGSSDGGEGAAANARDQDGTDAAPSISEALVSEGGETEVTEPSLFGGDDGAQAQGGAPQTQAAADFYRQIGSGRPAALPEHVLAARQGANSSVAATVGSASSVASLNLKATTFKIYPAEESEVDTLITKALVLGDFESAVDIALSNERFSDAILLAVRGGPELLARAQKAYFEQRTASFPYLRIFQSIVANDLSDVVQNADLSEWKEVFVVLCTFATADEFASLLEQLGQRLEYQYTVTVQSPTPAAAPAFRRDATLCYLAAGRLERVVTIWLQQMDEEEKAFVQSMGDKPLATVKFAAHARALQAFIEKVTVFQQAVSYVDSDLSLPVQDTAEAEARTYKLSSLYDRYMEYAELLASQGLVTVALKYVAQTPASYKAGEDDGPALTRKRLMRASGMRTSYAQSNVASAMQPQAQARPQYDGYSQQPAYQQPAYQQPQQPAYQQPAYQQPAYQQPQPATSAAYDDPYRPSGGAAPAATAAAAPAAAPPQPAYSQPAFAQPAFSQPAPNNAFQSPYDNITSFVPAPPAPMESAPAPSYQAPPPAAARPPAGSMPPPPPRAKGAWNDIPQIDRRPTPSQAPGAPGAKVAITSPFPNASPSMSPAPTFGAPGASGQVPPPPPSRGATRTPSQVPPPPRAGAMPPPAAKSPPPPAGYRSPPTSQPFPAQNGMQRGPSAGPYAAPASAAGPYMPAPPVASQAPPGPYAPPPAQAAPGPYAPQRPPSAAGGGAPAQPPPPPRGAMPPPRAAPPPGRAGVSPAQSPAPPAPAPARPELPKNKYRAFHTALLSSLSRG